MSVTIDQHKFQTVDQNCEQPVLQESQYISQES